MGHLAHPSSLRWSTFGHFGFFGHFGPLRLFWPLWLLGPFWGTFAVWANSAVWATLYHFGPHCCCLGHIAVLATLGYFVLLWATLLLLGPLWVTLVESKWPKLAQTAKEAHSGPKWPKLVQAAKVTQTTKGAQHSGLPS